MLAQGRYPTSMSSRRAVILWLIHLPSHSHWFFDRSCALRGCEHSPPFCSCWQHSCFLQGYLLASSFPASAPSLFLALATPVPAEWLPSSSLIENRHLWWVSPAALVLETRITTLKKHPSLLTLKSPDSRQNLGTGMLLFTVNACSIPSRSPTSPHILFELFFFFPSQEYFSWCPSSLDPWTSGKILTNFPKFYSCFSLKFCKGNF